VLERRGGVVSGDVGSASGGVCGRWAAQVSTDPLGRLAHCASLKSMTSFSGIPTELSDAVAYELDALEYLRTTLHGHVEAPVGRTSLVLGDLTPDGELRRSVDMQVTPNASGKAVRSALDRLRPLAFSGAFKLQDMIVEWILRANGVLDWPFSKKLAAYDKLFVTGTLIEPPIFEARPLLARAFWKLYKFFVPFRGSVVHSGGVTLERDGTVSIARGPILLRFTPSEQASYMRAMCLISKVMSGQVRGDPFLEHLIEADLLELQKYHGQAGLVVRHARIAALVVYVPPSHVVTATPLAVNIDFDQLRGTMEKTYPVGPDGRLYFSASVVVDDETREAIWELPIEAVPNGVVTLREGDFHYDQFLRTSLKTPAS